MNDFKVRNIAIVGGGTAGWMSAAILSRFLQKQDVNISLIESDDIGTVGVGEATVPLMQVFNGVLGIDEREFLKNTAGSFKMGIEFRDWGKIGNRYFHGFGDFGAPIEGISPHHHWLKLKMLGDDSSLAEYSFPNVAAQKCKFAIPPNDQSALFKHAYHFDAGLYSKFLRRYSEKRGVNRVEGKIIAVNKNQNTGFIENFQLDTGKKIVADFFIDCSGFRGLLIKEALGLEFEDWSRWLPANRAVVAPCKKSGEFTPYTVSTARSAGWQWRIPLQHRTGNGYVYCNHYISDDEAADVLLKSLDGEMLDEPRVIKFCTGHRKEFWSKNCVAVGLAGGFLEPLESTSIQLIHTSLARLIDLFPDKNFDPVIIKEYNRLTVSEYSRIRDFIILHYKACDREDSELWRYCKNMSVPEELQHKINVFKSCGRVPLLSEESYKEASWVSVFIGQNIVPRRYDPIVDGIEETHLRAGMLNRRNEIKRVTEGMPSHKEFVSKYCPSEVD